MRYNQLIMTFWRFYQHPASHFKSFNSTSFVNDSMTRNFSLGTRKPLFPNKSVSSGFITLLRYHSLSNLAAGTNNFLRFQNFQPLKNYSQSAALLPKCKTTTYPCFIPKANPFLTYYITSYFFLQLVRTCNSPPAQSINLALYLKNVYAFPV